ncbi:MAG: 2-oxo acid dehydrogenase subunit E2 [Dermatophilaceae bacterium]|nr:2-oxo acid dehydrogenase subunit E2 [Dermatophilaceae bacterium]
MAIHLFKLPDPGEGLLEAEIMDWKVAVGDTVKINDIVVEVETAKSLVELPIPWAGTVTELLANVGDEVEVGTAIIAIDDGVAGSGSAGGEAGTSNAAAPALDGSSPPAPAPAPAVPAGQVGDGVASSAAGDGSDADGEEPVKTLVGYGPKASSTSRRPRKRPAPAPPAPAWEAAAAATTPTQPERPVGDVDAASGRHSGSSGTDTSGAPPRVLAKPAVRKLAKDLGVDLGAVLATGDGGIVTSGDVERAAAEAVEFSAPTPTPQRAPGERETRTPIKGVRKMTAQAMVSSAFTAPHVTEWVTVDVTATMELVDRLKRDKAFADVKVTPLLILAKAMCLAVQRNPGVNASWDEAAQEIVTKHYVNLGVAAATPRGLVVPNIKDADAMTLHDLAQSPHRLHLSGST